MWGSIPACLRRHKKKFIFLGGVVGGVVILNTFLKRKFREWETQRTAEICDQIKRSNHFEGTMMTCDSVFLTCVPKIRQVITKTVDVNDIVKQVSTNPPNKIELWEQLKVLVFTQALGEMYAQCLLCILLRVQMSILSGYVFMSRCTTSSATEQQQKYMSRIEDFMLNGINLVLDRVQRVVKENLKSVPLHQMLKLQDVEKIVRSVQNSILESGENFLQDITGSLMPASSSSVMNNEFLDNISLETKDIIECRDFSYVLQLCVDNGISSLMDRLSECYVILSDGTGTFINPHDFSAPLAKLIPIMHNVFCQHKPADQDSFVHNLLQLEPLNNFAANIYEAFSQKKN
ncbi:peroxisomal biogenesis factor 3 [Trichonephila clavipes]|nr:peroxisomal biogenesis factor 3 [Trichonephila clavipes]